MSQDKPCGFDEFAKCVPKPVAAQEPDEAVIIRVEKIINNFSQACAFDDFEARIAAGDALRAALYANATPCARCAELEAKFRKMRPFNGRAMSVQEVEEWGATEAAAFIPAVQEYAADKDREIEELQAKITEQAAEIELGRRVFNERKAMHDAMSERIKALRDKLAKADAVILQAQDAMGTFKKQYPHMVKGYWYDALSAIEQYQKGE